MFDDDVGASGRQQVPIRLAFCVGLFKIGIVVLYTCFRLLLAVLLCTLTLVSAKAVSDAAGDSLSHDLFLVSDFSSSFP